MQKDETNSEQLNPKQAGVADKVSFSAKRLETQCAKRLQTSFGLAEVNARRFSRSCIEELGALYGGDRIYIPKRSIDRDEIRQQYNGGDGIDVIARRHGVAARTVRRIITIR